MPTGPKNAPTAIPTAAPPSAAPAPEPEACASLFTASCLAFMRV